MNAYEVTVISAKGRMVRPVIADNGPMAMCSTLRSLPKQIGPCVIKSKQVPHAR